jgi:hypothetical protein
MSMNAKTTLQLFYIWTSYQYRNSITDDFCQIYNFHNSLKQIAFCFFTINISHQFFYNKLLTKTCFYTIHSWTKCTLRSLATSRSSASTTSTGWQDSLEEPHWCHHDLPRWYLQHWLVGMPSSSYIYIM